MKRSMFALVVSLMTSGAWAWDYTSDSDKMTGKTTKSAIMRSINTISLDFPYAGTNHGYLQVRQHPTYGLDVIFYVDKGQLQCRSDDCKLMIRFDEKPASNFNGVEPADNSSDTIFLTNPQRFINEASKADRIMVMATFFRGGSHIFEFTTNKPLVWGKAAPAKKP